MTPSHNPKSDIAISTDNLKASYGEIEVLHGINLELPNQSIFALLGPNGGGKSTLLKVLAGLMQPKEGAVFFGQEKVADEKMLTSPEILAKKGLCLIPEGRGIFPNLNVKENLAMQTLLGRSYREIEEMAFSYFPQLKPKIKQMAGTLSGGEQQMLSLSRALCTSPKVLLLDELSMGLAPMVVAELYQIVAQLAGKGISILVVEQSAPTVTAIADTAAIMANGIIQKIGDPEEIKDELAAVYMGGDART